MAGHVARDMDLTHQVLPRKVWARLVAARTALHGNLRPEVRVSARALAAAALMRSKRYRIAPSAIGGWSSSNSAR